MQLKRFSTSREAYQRGAADALRHIQLMERDQGGKLLLEIVDALFYIKASLAMLYQSKIEAHSIFLQHNQSSCIREKNNH